jgi:hypothetical protein
MKALAGGMAGRGGDIQTSELLWAEIYRSADNDQLRRNAEQHLAALRAEEQIRSLNTLLDRYREREGHSAISFQDIVAARLLPGVLRDPYGVPYIIGADGRISLSPSSGIDLRLVR